MEHQVLIHNGKIFMLVEIGDQSSDIAIAAKAELLKMYCGDGYPDSCKVLSAQFEDPSNEGRILNVEI